LPNETTTKPQTFEWINNLRVIALFAVIVLHTASLMEFSKVPLHAWVVADFYNAVTRFAVPVFVMITGALLLHREYEIKDFLKRRLTRVVWPFLFWTIVFVIYSWYNAEIKFTTDTWANVNVVGHLFKYGAYYHMWYVYMLLGLYFFIPIISKFVRNASEKEILYFLIVWFVVMVLNQPYLSPFVPQIDMHYFIGYLGYLVLGHYLAFKELPQGNLKPGLVIYSIFCVAAITIGTYLFSVNANAISTIMYEPLGPFVVFFSSGIFLLARITKFNLAPSLVKTRDLIGGFSLGLYLCHAMFLSLMHDNWDIDYQLCNPILSIPLIALGCFISSFILVFTISKIPFIGKYIAG
jgi:surface polysaccharide O-acyltransferase-like enzyme